MKITIDVSDFYLDEESELLPSLRSHIIRECVSKISSEIKLKTEKAIDEAVKKHVDLILTRDVEKAVKEAIEEGTVKAYSGSQQVKYDVYVMDKLRSDTNWGSANTKIEQLAKQISEEFKKRYDLLFASQIVSKLNANGFLKDDVAKLILENK